MTREPVIYLVEAGSDGGIVKVTVNGQTQTLPDDTTAAGLIEIMGLAGQRLALEINGEIVPASTHQTRDFQHGDKIEIVHAVGGG